MKSNANCKWHILVTLFRERAWNVRERKAKSLEVTTWKQNQGINQGNQATRGSQERNHWNTGLNSFSLAEGNTKVIYGSRCQRETVFHAEESTMVRKRRNCRKLEMHIWLWADSHKLTAAMWKKVEVTKSSSFSAGAPFLPVFKVFKVSYCLF